MKLPPLSLLTVLESPIEFALNNTTYFKFMKFYNESFSLLFVIILGGFSLYPKIKGSKGLPLKRNG